MARLQISVLSCYPTVTERKSERDSMHFLWLQSARRLGFPDGTDNCNFDISCGSGGRLKMFASGHFRRSYATDCKYGVTVECSIEETTGCHTVQSIYSKITVFSLQRITTPVSCITEHNGNPTTTWFVKYSQQKLHMKQQGTLLEK